MLVTHRIAGGDDHLGIRANRVTQERRLGFERLRDRTRDEFRTGAPAAAFQLGRGRVPEARQLVVRRRVDSVRRALSDHRRFDVAGLDYDHADAPVAELDVHRLAQRLERPLARGVVAVQRPDRAPSQ